MEKIKPTKKNITSIIIWSRATTIHKPFVVNDIYIKIKEMLEGKYVYITRPIQRSLYTQFYDVKYILLITKNTVTLTKKVEFGKISNIWKFDI